ncbi:uncharacterized protein LOC143428374 [Xylocopa sonorina]|uniref:uncharacterized protein LOC143428374 n=1 Tax=Xylocopa sonorina TaxID=1818115 RepID=UPI00403AF844
MDDRWQTKEKGSKRKSCRGSVLEATRYCSQAPPDLHLYRLSANNASQLSYRLLALARSPAILSARPPPASADILQACALARIYSPSALLNTDHQRTLGQASTE